MAEENKDLFQKMGIDISNDKIDIDITQIKDFFNTMQKTFENSAQNIQKDISEGKVDMSENVGIKIDKENINIDLEKTRSFIEDLGKKIENLVGEIDKSVDNIEKR